MLCYDSNKQTNKNASFLPRMMWVTLRYAPRVPPPVNDTYRPPTIINTMHLIHACTELK